MDANLLNSLTEGDFSNGLPLRQSLAEGEFWTLVHGGYNVYRGPERVSGIDFQEIIATVFDAGTFQVPEICSHEAGRQYYYAIRRVSGYGKEEKGTTGMVRLHLDEEGNDISVYPKSVSHLRAQAESAGTIRISWFYLCVGQKHAPVRFRLYSDQATGSMDYENPIAVIPYKQDGLYEYLWGPGINNKIYSFAVRTVDQEGNENKSTSTVHARIDLDGPEEISGIQGQICF